jgi:RNA polymerase sigma-70 factor (ECF subfamily)
VSPASIDARDQGPPDFRTIYDGFHQKILRYLAHLVGPGDAEDLTQEVFARISQALPLFRGESSLSTWIYRIATNTAYDKLRSQASRRGREVAFDSGVQVADRAQGIEEKVARREMSDCVGEYVSRLPASYRSVVILSEREGLTNQEIADTLDLSLDTVKIRLHRARARLRKELGDGCTFYRDARNELACEPRPRGVSRHD